MGSSEILMKERETADYQVELANIYERVFPPVAKFVRDQGGTFEDAKDIFHDAFIIYLEIKSQDNKKIHTSDRGYIIGIVKHLWIRKYNSSRSGIFPDHPENEISIPEDFYPAVNDKRLLRFLELTGRKCMDLLRAFYYQKLPMKKLVSVLGYSNEHSVSVQKYKCLEKVRQSIKERSLTYEDFIE